MAKNAIYDWDTTAANNTDIGGINIAEGCEAKGMNNAFRELMEQIASYFKVLAFFGKSATNLGTAGVEVDAGGQIWLTRAGVSLLLNRLTSDGTVEHFYRAGSLVGSISVTAAGTTYTTTSDRRLKFNIGAAPSQIDWLKSVQVTEHEFKSVPGSKRIGVIAQDHINVSPDSVLAGDDGETVTEPWSVDASRDVYKILKVCQEQQALIEDLQARVAALEA